MMAAPRWDPDCLETFAAHYTVPETNPVIAPLLNARPGRVIPLLAQVSQPAFRHTAFYADIQKPMRLAPDGLSLALIRRGSDIGVLGFAPPRTKAAFEPQDLRLLEKLSPHLCRAFQITLRLDEVQAQADAGSSVLDRLAFGIAILDDGGRVVHLNAAGEGIVRQADGLSLAAQRLRAQDAQAHARLTRLVARAVDARERPRADAGGSVAVPRPSMRRPFGVQVAPLSGRLPALLAQRPAAVAFLSDPEADLHPPLAALAEQYDLTSAELRVAERLIAGQGVTALAATLGISRNTANTHVKRIFQKTGTSRQSELVRLLLAGAPPIG
jgi:DNA-binding CsgD family transcriptional regulator